MKVHKIEQKILELFTRGRDGQLISVIQYDSPEWNQSDNPENSLMQPILVSGYGFQESIVDILEERKELIKKYNDLKTFQDNEVMKYIKDLQRDVFKLKNSKKWYQFWK